LTTIVAFDIQNIRFINEPCDKNNQREGRKYMCKIRKKEEAGFTLIEMLVVVLMVAILAGAGAITYSSYTKNARVAEAIALAGAGLTAGQACAYSNPTDEAVQCTDLKLFPKMGVASTGLTADGRWKVAVSPLLLDAAATPPKFTAGSITVAGVATKDTEASSAGIFLLSDAWVSRCNLTSATVVVTDPNC
jgi:prepilin-type N-terminal cleavage/methylation domain-containing protein